MNASERFEIEAIAFRRVTGCWPPGKDVPAAVGGFDEAGHRAEWDHWRAEHGHVIAAIFSAIEDREKVYPC